MEILQLLGYALGLASLAGINLYLTVFAAGLAARLHWVVFPPQLQPLEVLGDPWIIGIAGTFYLLEFVADKVPWVDSVWDALHTFIRPLGAALLAILALGQAHPVGAVIAALLAGGVALTTHAAKSGVRLAANASPEPLTNVGLSLAGDAAVVGGIGLISWNPILALFVCLAVLALIWLVLPRMARGARSVLWLAWRKFNTPASGREVVLEECSAPAPVRRELERVHARGERIAWAVPCVSGKGDRVVPNHCGWLVLFEEPERKLFFVARRLFRGFLMVEVPVSGTVALRESRFLCERITLDAGERRWSFLLERGHKPLADRIVESWRAPDLGVARPAFAPVAG